MPRRGYIHIDDTGNRSFWSFSGPVAELPEQCDCCTDFADYQCDWVVGTRRRKDGTYKTCDAYLCRRHAQPVGSGQHDIHFCPTHAAMWEAQKGTDLVSVVRVPVRPQYTQPVVDELTQREIALHERLHGVLSEIAKGLRRAHDPATREQLLSERAALEQEIQHLREQRQYLTQKD